MKNLFATLVVLLLMRGALSFERFLFPVEDAFPISGRGTMVMGKVERGQVKVGDQLSLVGLGQDGSAKVVAIDASGRTVTEARTGDSVGILVSGPKPVRGQVLALPGSVTAVTRFEADLTLTRDTPADYRALFTIWTAMVSGRMDGALKAGQAGHVTITLEQPVVVEKGLKFTLREGTGVVTGI